MKLNAAVVLHGPNGMDFIPLYPWIKLRDIKVLKSLEQQLNEITGLRLPPTTQLEHKVNILA